jgi:arabinogalactan endo-1,4-beta-galactosidase
MRYLILFYKEKGDEKMRKRCLSGLLVFLGIVVLAGQNGIMTIKAASVIPKGVFAKGADVSWLSEMEYYNWAFYNDNWVKTDCLRILADHGINSIRLRLWVNPAKGFSDEQDMLKLAKRAKAMGFRLFCGQRLFHCQSLNYFRHQADVISVLDHCFVVFFELCRIADFKHSSPP